MNKSAFEMMIETITSDAGVMCAVKAWLITAQIIMALCVPIVLKETVCAIHTIRMTNKYERKKKNERK